MVASVEDLLSYISASGIPYKVISRSENGRVATILIRNPKDVPLMSARFSGTRPYRTIYGYTFVGTVRHVSGRIFRISV